MKQLRIYYTDGKKRAECFCDLELEYMSDSLLVNVSNCSFDFLTQHIEDSKTVRWFHEDTKNVFYLNILNEDGKILERYYGNSYNEIMRKFVDNEIMRKFVDSDPEIKTNVELYVMPRI